MPTAPGARRGAFCLAALLSVAPAAAQDAPLPLVSPPEPRAPEGPAPLPPRRPAAERATPAAVVVRAKAAGAAEAAAARDGDSLFAKSAMAWRPVLADAPAADARRRKSARFGRVPAVDLLFETGRFAPAVMLHPFTLWRGLKAAEPGGEAGEDPDPFAVALPPLRSGALRAGLIQETPTEPGFPRIAQGSVHWALEPPEALRPGAAPAVRVSLAIPEAGLTGELRIGRSLSGEGGVTVALTLAGPGAAALQMQDAPRLRRSGAREGEPLLGRLVQTTDRHFVFELSGEPVDRENNRRRLLGPPWIDIILKAEAQGAAPEQVLSIEKGALGNALLARVLGM
ncbi:hypothetical protein [Microvirga massiliensis]|uniref:hypothetical protein n=1 Tax=Microvirga massiliensis TaxID=1033741 RepID=UPI00062BA1B6|nr:hypothetical protein [Microvirga massiliensis]